MNLTRRIHWVTFPRWICLVNPFNRYPVHVTRLSGVQKESVVFFECLSPKCTQCNFTFLLCLPFTHAILWPWNSILACPQSAPHRLTIFFYWFNSMLDNSIEAAAPLNLYETFKASSSLCMEAPWKGSNMQKTGSVHLMHTKCELGISFK